MTDTQLHLTNLLLPNSELLGIQADEKSLLALVIESITKLESLRDSDDLIIDSSILGKNIRLISSYINMKYEFSVSSLALIHHLIIIINIKSHLIMHLG